MTMLTVSEKCGEYPFLCKPICRTKFWCLVRTSCLWSNVVREHVQSRNNIVARRRQSFAVFSVRSKRRLCGV